LLSVEATGRSIGTVTFTARKSSGDDSLEFQTITLTNAVIVGYEEKAGFAPRLALAYDAITVALTEQKPDGTAGATHTFTGSLALGGGLAPLPAGALDPVVPVDVAHVDYFLKVPGIAAGLWMRLTSRRSWSRATTSTWRR
jgi:hypothetical protein